MTRFERVASARSFGAIVTDFLAHISVLLYPEQLSSETIRRHQSQLAKKCRELQGAAGVEKSEGDRLSVQWCDLERLSVDRGFYRHLDQDVVDIFIPLVFLSSSALPFDRIGDQALHSVQRDH